MNSVTSYTDYLDFINNNKCIVKFTAKWCGPCKKLTPIFNSLAKEYEESNIKFLEVNIDKSDEITHYENIQGVPTILFYNNGNRCADLNIVGFNPSLTNVNIKLFNDLPTETD